jgi:cytochrome c biogenesis protein CcmG, thiol:disulfide interchange protein DsbE
VIVARRRWLAALLAAVLATIGLAGCARGGSVPAGGMHRVTGESLPALRAAAALEACPAAGTEPATSAATLPDLTLPCLGVGEPVPLRRLGGAPLVLNLWASWCGPCRQELPAFQQLHATASSRIRVLGVVTEDAPDSALSFTAAAGVHFPSVVDATGKLKRALGRSLLPATLLVRADGRIAQVYTGRPLQYADPVRMVRARLGVALT